MMRFMSTGAGGVFAKILLGLLILSFSVWGIEDMLRYRGTNDKLATVDGHDIPLATFERAYRNEAERVRTQLGANATPQLLRMLNLEQKVLQDIITEQVLLLETRRLGIVPSDNNVAAEIGSQQAFRDEAGRFNKGLYRATLQRNGLSEKAFVNNLRQEMATNLLLRGVTSRAPLSNEQAALQYAAESEEREVNLAVLTPALVKDLPAPTPEQVAAYYADNKESFNTPEYRTIGTLSVSKAQLLATIAISEEELKEAYQERAALFGADAEPFEKMRGSLEQDARNHKLDDAVASFSARLEDMLAAGDTLPEIAKELKLEHASYGPINAEGETQAGAKASLPEYPGFLATAFALEEGSETPLKPASENSYYLMRVESVTPETPQPLEKVQAQVIARWKRDETAARLKALADKLSADAQKSPTPAAVLTQAGVSLSPSGMLKREAQKTASGQALPLPLMREIFTTPIGKATAAHPLPGGNYVLAVVARRQAPAVLTPEQQATDEKFKEARQRYADAGREQLLEEYMQHLRGKYHVTINQEALKAFVEREQ